MAFATSSGCVCGARCPPFGTRWTEAALPLKAFLCISSLMWAGLTVESVVLKVERSCTVLTHTWSSIAPQMTCTGSFEHNVSRKSNASAPLVQSLNVADSWAFVHLRVTPGRSNPSSFVVSRRPNSCKTCGERVGDTPVVRGPADHEELNHPLVPCLHPFCRK
jgi:hypothetical protein